MIRLFISLILFFILSSPSWATTWYVRDGGGAAGNTSTTCNGQTNATFTGANGPNCAFNNPGWVWGSNNASTGNIAAKWVGGDTLYINGDSDINSGSQAKYIIGFGWSLAGAGFYCSPTSQGGKGTTYSSSCEMLEMPAGISAAQPTSIIGTGTHRPLFYNVAQLYAFLEANNNYLTIQWIEMTDTAACANNDPTQGCNSVGGYVGDGIELSGTGLTLTDVYIHGLGRAGINGNGVFGNATFTRVWTIGNGQEGINLGSDGNEAFTGTLTFNQPIIEWNGCVEAYPLTYPGIDNPLNYTNCFGQISGGYGDGLAFGATGSTQAAGNWTVIGPGSISFNTQDGLDILHGLPGVGTDNIDKMRFEGNAGQQIKISGGIENVTNSLIIGDCGWWYEAPQSLSGGMGPGDACRASGSTIRFWVNKGTLSNFYNNTIITNAIALEANGGSTCDGTTIVNYDNNIIQGGYTWPDDSNFVPGGGNSQTTNYYNDGNNGNGGGSCGSVSPTEDYNIIYGNKNSNFICAGAHDQCGTNPGFTAGLFPAGTSGGALNTFYQGQSGITLLPISNSSPAKNAGKSSGLTYWNTENDYYDTVRSSPSIGGLEYNSSAASGYLCFFNSDCTGNSCTNNYCGGSCTANSGACTDNLTCCSPICSSGTCSGCISNGTLDGGSASNCCSGIASGGTCVASVCGDGIISGSEICDTLGPNLNNQTCYTQGFIQGTLGCTSCTSFNTSSCNNSCITNGSIGCTVNGQCCSTICSAGQCITNVGDITTGLVDLWKFDDGTGSTATDNGTNALTGTLENSPTWVSGKIGTHALSFVTASNQYVDVGTSSGIRLAFPFTLSAWVNLTDLSNAYVILGNGIDTSNSSYSGADLQIKSSTGDIQAQYGNGSAPGPGARFTFTTNSGISSGGWHLITGVFTNSSTVTVYVDGSSAAGVTSGSATNISYNTSYSGKIGSQGFGNTSSMNGAIDDVRIYNRALSSVDITALYQYTGSCTLNGGACSSNPQCCSDICSNGACANSTPAYSPIATAQWYGLLSNGSTVQ